ncbi:hypothetical protein CU669_19110 [Paramagnetospirillum kuznetsovii]|uniref:Uncharacterized protein n=2 Tax=Paramagnetospirillum kuznetsovii TaxID=2053833 RepID=A0A364NT82_9PROT|nr:hypothetical protein CU669_19110 [Paramagnetospirillum kuznetsovii]
MALMVVGGGAAVWGTIFALRAINVESDRSTEIFADALAFGGAFIAGFGVLLAVLGAWLVRKRHPVRPEQSEDQLVRRQLQDSQEFQERSKG